MKVEKTQKQNIPFVKVSNKISQTVDRMSDSEIDRMLTKMMLSGFRFSEAPKTPLVKINELCRTIVRYDTAFQNLNSERELAATIADKIFKHFQEIKLLCREVKDDELEGLVSSLRILDHPFMRVLGDRLAGLFKDKNFEDELKGFYRGTYITARKSKAMVKQYLAVMEKMERC